jgi:Zn-dependent protease with chaperone function
LLIAVGKPFTSEGYGKLNFIKAAIRLHLVTLAYARVQELLADARSSELAYACVFDLLIRKKSPPF